MSTTAFATRINAAEAREATKAALLLKEQTDAAAALATLKRNRETEAAMVAVEAAQKAAQTRVNALRRFGNDFLEAVAFRVVRPEWTSARMTMIQDYCHGLLSLTDKNLPGISAADAKAVLGKFEYGLTLAARNGLHIPDDFFYGQRLLAAREVPSLKVVEPRLVIVKGERPRHPQTSTAVTTQIDLKPAITPVTKKDRRASAKKARKA